MDDKFPGFQLPEENWSKLPHQLIEALPKITSQGELMVVLYILRHTWGYREYGQFKKITLDEFMHGRKTKNLEDYPTGRMDGGIGMSKDAILRGLKRAEKDGFIEIEIDDSDKARIKKYYVLRMSESQTPDSDVRKSDPEVSKSDSQVRKSDNNGTKVRQRSEKETLERNPKKKTEGKKGKKQFSSFPSKDQAVVKAIVEQTETHPDQFDLGRITENAPANYALPPSAGGSDAAVHAGIVALAEAKGSRPPRVGSGGYVMLVEKFREPLGDQGEQDPDVAMLASKMLWEDKPAMANPYYSSFRGEYGDYLGRAREIIDKESKRQTRDLAQAEASQAALAERLAARGPPVEDCPVGAVVKHELKQHVAPHLFKVFVVPARFVQEDGVLHIAAPDVHSKGWLEGHVGETIARILKGFTDGPERVEFEVEGCL